MKTETYIRTEDQDFKKEPPSIYVEDKTGENEDAAWDYAVAEAEKNFGKLGEDFNVEWIEYDGCAHKHIFHVHIC